MKVNYTKKVARSHMGAMLHIMTINHASTKLTIVGRVNVNECRTPLARTKVESIPDF
jgi:hypothetical protein